MRILVTGATGFIGQAFCRTAVARGHQLLALCRHPAACPPEVELAVGTIADTPWALVERFSPDAALHLAWLATPGVYLTSPHNEQWLEQSKTWLQRASAIGVSHIAAAGTCIEYAPSDLPLDEATSPLGPSFPYSRAKAALFEWLNHGGLGSVPTWSWLRIFYPYGPGEHPSRICSSLIAQLSAGKRLELRTPFSVKDYIYIDDAASAICSALEARLGGAVNIGTGHGLSIETLARTLADQLGADPTLVGRAAELATDPNPVVIASPDRLRGLGWLPRVEITTGFRHLIDRRSAEV